MWDFRDEFKREFGESEFKGAPQARHKAVIEWLRPRGGTVTDGVRLAVINAVGLVAAALLFFVLRLIGHFTSLPLVFSVFFVALALIAVGVWFWHRYAGAHGAAARQRGRTARTDLFAGIGALPFIFVAVLEIFNGVLRLLLALVTFSAHRALTAIETVGIGSVFFGLTIALILIAREAVE
jgi:hypothetical protein